MTGRHPGTEHALSMFDRVPVNDEVRERMDAVRGECAALAHSITAQVSDGPELTAGLRKLVEAKDCFVRALL